MNSFNGVDAILDDFRQKDLLRKRRAFTLKKNNIVSIDNNDYINFSSNDYLGLAQDERLKSWYKEFIDRYGTSSSSSPLICGYTEIHQQLENKIAKFFNRDRAIIFSSGYLANLAIASTFIDKSLNIFQDKLCHASLIDTARLSSGNLIRYRHNDYDHLRILLEKHETQNAVVMTDGLFSMDGDVADIKQLSGLCEYFKCLLFVDDAHGIGALGDSGGGLLQQQSISQREVPLLSGTFGKAFGMSGAFIAGEGRLIDLLVQKARPYIYSTSIPTAAAATLINVFDLVAGAKSERESLQNNIKFFLDKIKVKTNSDTHIQPIIMGDPGSAITLSNNLQEEGCLAVCIRPPTVPKDTSRIRVSLSAAHSQDQINHFTQAVNRFVSND